MITNTKLHSIAFIIPYFGKLPNYFDYWLESCRHNPTINWIIFTDDKTPFEYPDNVKVVYSTFDEIIQQVQSKFEFEIALSFPYKFSDFKPTYGYVFAEFLKSYDFWGFCDIDLVFGDIRSFITQEVLSSNDKILANGHFCLIKNNQNLNKIFKSDIIKKKKYKEVYAIHKYCGFDEYGDEAFNSICIKSNINIYINNLIFADLNSFKKHFALTYVRRLVKKNELKRLQWEEKNQNHSSIFEFNKGVLTRHYIKDGKHCKQEYMYVHFQKRKMNTPIKNYFNNQFLMIPNKFVIAYEPVEHSHIIKFGKKSLFPNRRLKRQIRVKIRTIIKNSLDV